MGVSDRAGDSTLPALYRQCWRFPWCTRCIVCPYHSAVDMLVLVACAFARLYTRAPARSLKHPRCIHGDAFGRDQRSLRTEQLTMIFMTIVYTNIADWRQRRIASFFISSYFISLVRRAFVCYVGVVYNRESPIRTCFMCMMSTRYCSIQVTIYITLNSKINWI